MREFWCWKGFRRMLNLRRVTMSTVAPSANGQMRKEENEPTRIRIQETQPQGCVTSLEGKWPYPKSKSLLLHLCSKEGFPWHSNVSEGGKKNVFFLPERSVEMPASQREGWPLEPCDVETLEWLLQLLTASIGSNSFHHLSNLCPRNVSHKYRCIQNVRAPTQGWRSASPCSLMNTSERVIQAS